MDASREARARRLDATIAMRFDSNDELATVAGFSASEISRWRTGERTPKRDKLETLAPLLGCTVDWLIAGDDLRRVERKIDRVLEVLGASSGTSSDHATRELSESVVEPNVSRDLTQ